MELRIEQCTAQKVKEVGAFYDAQVLYMDTHDVNYPLWNYKVYPSADSVRECTENGSQYLCADGERICAAFVLNDEPGGKYENGYWKRNLKTGEYLVIHTLAVEHDLAGQGIGGRIVEFCIDKARTAGYRAVRVDVVPTNLPVIRLYERKGFTFAGEVDLERGITDIPRFCLYEYNF